MTSISNGSALTSALQSNVLAIRNNQSLIDQVQQRLATGQRVDSAIDNPSNFFQASALSSRAARLNTVLDSIISKLGTVQQANNALTSLQDLVNQADAIADSAQEQLTSEPPKAQITGDRSLSSFTDLPTNLAGVDNGDRLVFSFVDTDGSINSGNIVTISNGDSTNDVINAINAIVDTGASQVFEATLNSAGQLDITTKDDTRFEIDFQTSGGAADTQLVSALGFGDFITSEVSDGTSATRITVVPTHSLTTAPLFAAGGSAATASTTLLNLTDSAAGAARDIFDGDANDAINISINGESAVEIISDISTATVQDLIDGINNSGSLNTNIEASFNAGSSELNIRAVDSDVTSIQIELVEDGAAAGTAGKIDLQKLGIGAQVLQSAADGSGNLSSESLQLGPGADVLADLEVEFDSVRTQIDELAADSEFDSVNLLLGDDLVTSFNETGSSTLTTEGSSFTATSLGVSEANFGRDSTIDDSVDDVAAALQAVESFATSLATDIAVIESRQTFTEETVTTLNEGASDLTASDENEDSALLLALQNRQLLGVTALSLAAQAQQSTLRLF